MFWVFHFILLLWFVGVLSLLICVEECGGWCGFYVNVVVGWFEGVLTIGWRIFVFTT